MNRCCRCSISCVNNYDQRERERRLRLIREEPRPVGGRRCVCQVKAESKKSREANSYSFWEDKTGFRQPSDRLRLININTVFIMSTNRSLDRLILSKAFQNRLPDSKTHSSCEKESEIADSFGSMTVPQTCYRGAASLTFTFYCSLDSVVHAWFPSRNK